jgi:biotin carboxyl carrier protein
MPVHRLPGVLGAIVIGAIFSAGLAPAIHAQPNETIAHAAISGQVQPLRLAQVGQTVKQGDILLFVRTSTGGTIPAARAPVDGRVIRMLVNVGDTINIGDPVAVIGPQ